MTPESRILESINSARGQSAWSPMPEHLLFLQMKKNKPETPVTPEGSVNTCDDCGMKFKTEAMLTYHRIGYCVGQPTEELPQNHFKLPSEETIMLKQGQKSDKDLTRDAAQTKATVNSQNTKRQSKLEWCTSTDGAVPPSAVKVGYDDHDQTHTYVCLAQVSEEVIPGTVLPSRKHATVALNGEELRATEYSVLTDHDGYVSWKRCDVVGGIPRGAVKAGYDSKKLQYFIARAKAPDGTYCCGQYIPHKQQCYFAWEGTEFTAKDFEFLCKKYSEQQFVKLGSRKKQPEVHAADTLRQPPSSGTEIFSLDKNNTRDLTEMSNADIKLSKDLNTNSNSNKIPGPGKGSMEKGADKDTNAVTRPGTGVIKQDNTKATADKTGTSASKELTKSGTGIVTRDKDKATSSREKTKSGTAMVSRNKSGTAMVSRNKNKPNSSRVNSGVRPNSKNLQF